MIAILVALGICAVHAIRGRGWFPFASHLLSSLLNGGIAAAGAWALGFSGGDIAWTGGVVSVGMLFWVMFGWGKYFSCFTGRDNPLEEEIEWIDDAGYKRYPSDGLAETNKKRGAFCFALRGLYAAPMFAVLAIVLTPWAALFIPLTAGQALCNMAGRVDDNYVRYGRLVPEICEGLLLGSCIALTLILA